MNIHDLLSLADKGDPGAQNDLGVSYMTGDGVMRDAKKAAELFCRAAAQGHPAALKNFGMCLVAGEGIEKNIGDGLRCLESACVMGEKTSIDHLLSALKSGDVDSNDIIAFAERDDRAKWILGLCYNDGVCLPQNSQKAIGAFLAACRKDSPIALWIMGHLFSDGDNPDYVKARFCFDKLMDVAEKQVGGIRNVQMLTDISHVNEKIKSANTFLLMKVLPECKKDGKPNDQYVTDMLDGKLFMKALDQFSDLKNRDASSNNGFRGDPLEGYSKSFGCGYDPHFYSSKDGSIINPDNTVGSVDVLALRRKVYCLTAIDYYTPTKALIPPSKKMKEFGKYAVIICDVEEFLKRVRNAFQRYCHDDNAAYELRYDRVSYDVDLIGQFDYDEFHKTEDYSWQNEFRISVDFTEGKFSEKILADITDFAKLTFPWKIEIDNNPLSLSDSLYFEIGDIRDICVCVDVDQFFEGKESISIQEEPSHIEPQNMPHKPRPSFYKRVSIISSSDGIHLGVSEKALYGA